MSNRAAWLTAKAKQFKIDSAPYPKPAPDEVIIKNAAVAINPVDWKLQDSAYNMGPVILGSDFAGEIVQVGSSVSGLAPGQRVIAYAQSLWTKDNKHSAFQHYVAVPSIAVAPLPSSISFTHGCVLPVAVSTAAAGLYQPGYLELPLPSATPTNPDKTKSLLVWAGSSSVGSATVQLASASGLTVFATASPSNFEFVKSLGAKEVFDHSDDQVVKKIVDAVKGTELVGAFDAISLANTVKKCAEVVKAVRGKGFVATVLRAPHDLPYGIESRPVFAPTIFFQHTDIGKAIWGNFVPEALKDGRLQPKPDPLVVGKGLEKIQDGVDKQRGGVSAKKVVVEL